jgi:hypothetical protein
MARSLTDRRRSAGRRLGPVLVAGLAVLGLITAVTWTTPNALPAWREDLWSAVAGRLPSGESTGASGSANGGPGGPTDAVAGYGTLAPGRDAVGDGGAVAVGGSDAGRAGGGPVGGAVARGGGLGGSDGAGAVVTAVEVLREWDEARAAAYASGSVRALRALYVGTSGASDVRLLRSYLRRDYRVEGMRMQLIAVTVLDRGDRALRLRVTDRLQGAVAVRAGREEALPRDRASTRVVRLSKGADGSWRVVSVRLS